MSHIPQGESDDNDYDDTIMMGLKKKIRFIRSDSENGTN